MNRSSRFQAPRRPRFPHCLPFLLVAVMVAGLLAACGGSAPPPTSTQNGPGALASSARPAASAAASAAGAGYAAASAAPAAAAPARPTTTSGATGQPPAIPEITSKIIKNGTLGLVVLDVDYAVTRARLIARQYGGDVAQANNTQSGSVRVADLVLQVDSGQFEEAMQALRTMQSATGEKDFIQDRKIDKTESKDVTEEYVDVQAQVKNLQVTEAQLQVLMDKAQKIEDILAIQRELNTVRGQIERLQGRATYLERRSATSQIALHLEEPVAAVPSPPPPVVRWSFAEVVGHAWARSLSALQSVITAITTIIIFLWWIILPIGIALIARRVLQQRRNRPVGPTPPATRGPSAAA